MLHRHRWESSGTDHPDQWYQQTCGWFQDAQRSGGWDQVCSGTEKKYWSQTQTTEHIHWIQNDACYQKCTNSGTNAIVQLSDYINLHKVRRMFGIHGSVLNWIKSLISDCTQTVSLGGQQSMRSVVLCGMPQGSVLGPVLFLLYTANVTAIAQRHGLQLHSYADDTQLYFHYKCAPCETRLLHLTSRPERHFALSFLRESRSC